MKCKVCGKKVLDSFCFTEKRICITCDTWTKRIDEFKSAEPYEIAIINGVYYFIGDEDSKSPFRGFAGRKFQITFNDGHRVITTNLWCGGDVPEHFKGQFPDNAIFDNGLVWKQIGPCKYLVKDE